MTDTITRFLIVNLAFTGGILVVFALRKLVRAQFGARIGYALWLLPLLVALVTFMPPRVVDIVVAAPEAPFFVTPGADTALIPAPEVASIAPPAAVFDPWLAAELAWIAGMIAMATWLALTQSRFMKDARAGKAGPAVVGFMRPHIITPSDFETRFDAREQDVILAHETIHLKRQDARINALVALLRCVCWFNPLVHLAAHVLRIDQELACDAVVVERNPKARRLYADALLKAQLAARPLPLGCFWPAGTEHPLMERIEMLKRTTPGRLRRRAGAGLLIAAALAAGCTTWAALPASQNIVVRDYEIPRHADGPARQGPTLDAAQPVRVAPTGLDQVEPEKDVPAPAKPQPVRFEPQQPAAAPAQTVLNATIESPGVQIHADRMTTRAGAETYEGNVRVQLDNAAWFTLRMTGPTISQKQADGAGPPPGQVLITADRAVGGTDGVITFDGNIRIASNGQVSTTEHLAITVSATAPKPKAPPAKPAPAGFNPDDPVHLRGTVEKIDFGDTTYVAYVRATETARDPGAPAQPDTHLWQLSPMNYWGDRDAVTKDILNEKVNVLGLRASDKACSPNCRIYVRGFVKCSVQPTFTPGCAGIDPYVAAYRIRFQPQQTQDIQGPQFAHPPGTPYSFNDVFDAEDALKITGKIQRVEFKPAVTLIWIEAQSIEGAHGGPVTEANRLWMVEGLAEDKLSPGIRDYLKGPLSPGAPVVVRGYNAKDKSCKPDCRINGRDVTFPDMKKAATPTSGPPVPPGWKPFAATFDANAPLQLDGKITKVETIDSKIALWVQAEFVTAGNPGKPVPDTHLWRVDQTNSETTSPWVDDPALVGKQIHVRGYNAKDVSCTPACHMAGRDAKIVLN